MFSCACLREAKIIEDSQVLHS
jgi:hypothetical protein